MNEVIEFYYKKYGIGRGLCAEAIRRFGDSKRTHRFLEFLKNVKENCTQYKMYDKTFDELYYDYSISQASA